MHENGLSKQYNDTGRLYASTIKQVKPNKTELKIQYYLKFTYLSQRNKENADKIMYCLLSSTTSNTHGCLYMVSPTSNPARAPHFACAMHLSVLICQKVPHESFNFFLCDLKCCQF